MDDLIPWWNQWPEGERSPAELRFMMRVKVAGMIPLWRGWPDFMVVGPDGKIRMLVEVKGRGDHLSKHQRLMHELLRSAGLDVRVVSTDEEMDAIHRELKDSPCGEVHPLFMPKPRPGEPGEATDEDVAQAVRMREEMLRRRAAERVAENYLDKSAPSSATDSMVNG